ncbi:unnamed protein product [Spirodela intermedia]|uniref:Transmembrane 9 superfamily member n=1 Tax=Spirodela intermedia TaxID=51605 RepID=A0A7I8KE62_SPIIN|nr:unnamed protein product [Spirodela intermedia]
MSYRHGEEIYALAGPMSSVLNHLPMDYYPLPSCETPQGGRPPAPRNLGEIIASGTIRSSSPYRFRVNVNESLYLCTTAPLTRRDVHLLVDRKLKGYIVNMFLDDLPLLSFDQDFSFKTIKGFLFSDMSVYPVDQVYVRNHLKFRISLHEVEAGTGMPEVEDPPRPSAASYEIVGFEVVKPCSVARRPGEELNLSMYETIDPPDCRWDRNNFMEARPGERVTFTYEYVMSRNISWSSRWDRCYVDEGHDPLFSLARSSGKLLLFVIVFFVKHWRSTLRELATVTTQTVNGRIPGWKLIAGEIFRPPSCPKLLCAAVGTGVQIFVVAFVCVALGALSVIYPSPSGILLTWILNFYLLFGALGGYVGARLWRNITGGYEGWTSLFYSTAALFPGVVVLAVGTLSSFLCLLALWGGVLSPVTFLGGFLAARRRSYPVSNAVIPPHPRGEAAATAGIRQGLLWVMIVAFSYLIFADIEREFRLVIDSLCYGRYYKITALTTATVLLWAIACSTYSIIVAYFHIYAGDSRWWWKSLLVSGFSGAHAFFIAVRAVGFLSTLYFVRFLYASAKL